MHQRIWGKLLYEQKQFPVFQNRLYDTKEEAIACPLGDIALVEDPQTGLVYNASFSPEAMKYDTHYQNEQALSSVFRSHLESVSHLIKLHLGKHSLVEIGCGKGFFLELLSDKGFDIVGFDPTYEGENLRIRKTYFEEGVELSAKGLILRHVLEHIKNPMSFLFALKKANGGRGRIYIEVPCFDWICRRRAWFDIYYEHVNYFRLSDFGRMFDKIIDSGRLFGNQYLYVVAELETLRMPERNPDDAVNFPEDFTKNIFNAKSWETGSVIWGASSKGVIFALMRERIGRPIEIVIDINPAKQGKYLPATGLLVQSPEQALKKLPKGSPICVMNSNYLEEIKEMSNNAFNYVVVDHE